MSYLQAPFDRVADTVWHGTVRRRRWWERGLPDYPDCLDRLDPFSVPVRHYLIIGCDSGWTALVDNNALGGEPSIAGPVAMVDLPQHGRWVTRDRAEALAWLEVHD